MADDAASLFKSSEVVPDVVPSPPKDFLSVTYTDQKVEFGIEFTPTQVKDAPVVTWEADPSKFYTLCMSDPDAPSRWDPKLREVLHWLIVNISGSDLASGQVLAEYRGSGPPQGTGLHRYCFLLYQQPSGKISFDEKPINKVTRTGRPNFSIRRFADKYGLGAPVAGNMYQAQYDDYVPTLYATYVD